MLNKIKKNPYVCMAWVMLSTVVHIALFKTKVEVNYQIWQRILAMIIALGITFPLHELLHFAFAKIFCKGKVEIKMVKSPIGLPTIGVVAQGEFHKWKLVIFYLAPFMLLTVFFDVLFIFYNKVGLVFFIIPLCNSAGSFYDIIEAFIVMRKKS